MEPDYSDYNARANGTYGKIWTATGKCVFCDLRDKYIVKRGELCALTVNLFPYIDGQLLITPFRHVEDFTNLTKPEWEEMYDLLNLGVKLIRNVFETEEIVFNLKSPGGFKANKTVPHLHMNIIPSTESLMVINAFDISVSPINLATRYREVLSSIK